MLAVNVILKNQVVTNFIKLKIMKAVIANMDQKELDKATQPL